MIKKIRGYYLKWKKSPNSKIDRDKFCPIPFLQLQLNPLGDISACCFSDQYNIGNIKNSSLAEIWNGQKIQEWRKEFISGDIRICKHAMATFQCHKFYQHLIPYVDLSEKQKKLPRRFDLRLNGMCNLSCIMCDVWRDPNHLYDQSDFWKIGPKKIFPYLLEIDMLGGEPFIQKDTYRLIHEVSKVNSSCSWGFITNAQYKFTDKIKQELDKIKIRHIQISLDAISSETYKKIRVKGILEKSLKTIDHLIEYREERRSIGKNEFALFVSICIQKLNWQELGEFLSFCKIKKITPIVQDVVNRDDLSVHSLPTTDQEELINNYKQLLLQYPEYEQHINVILEPVKDRINSYTYTSARYEATEANHPI